MSTDGGATWSTNCAGAPNTPDDRMWFAGTGASANGNLTLYQDYDAVDSALLAAATSWSRPCPMTAPISRRSSTPLG